MIFQPRFEVDAVLSALERATMLMGVPTFYTRLLDDPRLDPAVAAGIRLFISGSAPLSGEVHRSFENRTGHRILERYGMTETGMLTSNPRRGERRAGSVGPALAGVEVRVTDPEDGRMSGCGEVGVVQVRGPNVFAGYWRMPEKTAAEFTADGWFVTGDLGRLDEDGYLWLVGRQKDLIISGGYNVYPAEIEAEIDALEGVRESAVIGLPHPDFGEAVAAVLVMEPGASQDPESITDRLRDRLAGFKVPKSVFFRAGLPRNAMSKVLKSDLRAEYAAKQDE
jgi:malonyl-CoA/methylmalonyl-CoA synthetase